ncbi:AAEL007723-PA [Aedes aegypti]|uniref:AAEL007723-PA n=1 Tax=Aedes aegypti TaxID=7159 RepID=Q0IEX3_AEDAE|nr:AAEL007723-PA [Aedes aegypti]
MEEHVQRNDNKKHRKLVRSYEQISPACDILPSPTGGTSDTKQTSPSMTMVLQPAPNHGLAVKATTGSVNMPTVAMIQSPKTPSPSLASPQTLSRSFEQAVAQSPPKYQMYHQFSRKSNTTQQFVQRQQQLQQSLSQTQLPSPTHQPSPLIRKPSITQQTGAEWTDNSKSLSSNSSNYYHHSLKQSQPMDQRSNNPFILNFNNISGCCIKNSSPSNLASPTANTPVNTGSSQTTSTPSPSVPARRSRSLLLKSSTPLQQPHPPVTQLSTPQNSSPCPPVPPRLSKSPTPTKETAPPSTVICSTIATSTIVVTSATTASHVTNTSCIATLTPTSGQIKRREVSPPALLATTSAANTPSAIDKGFAAGPAVATKDVRMKRDDFLKATMKICLVVSPPSCKLQIDD